MLMRLLSLLLLVMSCTPAPSNEDTCEPNGHIHRSAQEGDWCHCSEGYKPSESGLFCEVDPTFAPPGPFTFGQAPERACWHILNGPFEVGSNLSKFKTVYTVKLALAENGQYRGQVSMKAWKTGRFALFLSEPMPVVLKEGVINVPSKLSETPSACSEWKRQEGYELVSRVSYTLELGPSPRPEIKLMLEEVP